HRSATRSRGAGSSGADRPPGTPVAERPRTDRAASPPLHVAGSGSEVSLGQLLEHGLVELGLVEELLQPRGLALELLEPLRVARLHAAVLGDPAVPGRLRDLQMSADLGELGPAGEELVALGELADDLVWRVPPTLGHGCCPPAPASGHGLVQHLADYVAVSSPYRAHIQLIAELAAITGEDDEEPPQPGVVPAEWVQQRCVGQARLVGDDAPCGGVEVISGRGRW